MSTKTSNKLNEKTLKIDQNDEPNNFNGQSMKGPIKRKLPLNVKRQEFAKAVTSTSELFDDLEKIEKSSDALNSSKRN